MPFVNCVKCNITHKNSWNLCWNESENWIFICLKTYYTKGQSWKRQRCLIQPASDCRWWKGITIQWSFRWGFKLFRIHQKYKHAAYQIFLKHVQNKIMLQIYVYDAEADTWSETARLGIGRCWHAITQVNLTDVCLGNGNGKCKVET